MDKQKKEWYSIKNKINLLPVAYCTHGHLLEISTTEKIWIIINLLFAQIQTVFRLFTQLAMFYIVDKLDKLKTDVDIWEKNEKNEINKQVFAQQGKTRLNRWIQRIKIGGQHTGLKMVWN